MARPQRPYSFIKRKTRKNEKPIYYARIGSWDDYYSISTGKTSKAAAERFVIDYLEAKAKEERGEIDKKSDITFAMYTADFWDPEGKFAQGRRARLRTITNGYLDNCKGTTTSYLVPKWGNYKLSEITASLIDSWVLSLVKDPVPNLMGKKEGVRFLKPATINRILQIMRTIMEQACTEGLIQDNPAKFVKPVSNASAKKKGILTPDEVKALLNPEIWDDYRHYAINLLALTTGMRISEIRGLQVHQIHKDYIEVHTAWADKHGLKEPKWGSARDIPITEKVYEVLLHVVEKSRPQSIVFYAATSHDKPMSKSYIEHTLYKTLEKIKINETQRLERNLTFHSHRHTLNTLLRAAGVPDPKIRMMTGHRQESMTELYTHFRREDFKEIATATEGLI